MGVSYVRQGLTQDALRQFYEVLDREPQNLTALLDAASLEMQTSRFLEGEGLYRRAAI